MRLTRILWMTAAVSSVATGCAHAPAAPRVDAAGDLVGAWRSRVQFRTGAFADVKDLEFMYVFHAGGTLTESSNYDAAPPVPPAYGVWRRTADGAFEARYEFYTTRPPAKPEDLVSSGWQPSGRGVLAERIAVSSDGATYTSTIRYEPLDAAGRAIDGGGEAEGHATRIRF